jgi:transcriptional regulator with XRE-family HTH domain
MRASYLVKHARQEAGLSVRELARLAGVSPNTVHLIEKDETNPTIETLEQLLEATGSTLELNESVGNAVNAFGLVRSIREYVATGDTSWVIRMTAQFVSWMDKKSKTEILRLLIMAPPTTGSIEWDAFVAGIVEWIAHKAGLDVSGTWVEEPQYYLNHAVWIGSRDGEKAIEFAGTPTSLKIRGFFLHRDSLVNL